MTSSSRPARRFGGALPAFVFLPGDGLRGRVLDHRLTENMRVAGDHLGGDCGDNIVEIEELALLRDARVIDDLEQEIAELFLQPGPVLVLDRAGDLVGFLDRVGRDGLESLLDVPRAAAIRVAQAAHDVEQGVDVGFPSHIRLIAPIPSPFCEEGTRAETHFVL